MYTHIYTYQNLFLGIVPPVTVNQRWLNFWQRIPWVSAQYLRSTKASSGFMSFQQPLGDGCKCRLIENIHAYYVYMCTYTYMCVCVCICINIYIYTYMYFYNIYIYVFSMFQKRWERLHLSQVQLPDSPAIHKKGVSSASRACARCCMGFCCRSVPVLSTLDLSGIDCRCQISMD